MIIKMRKNIILINFFLALGLFGTVGCSETSTDLAESQAPGGDANQATVLGSNQEGLEDVDLSVFPLSVDPDQDNVPDVKFKDEVALDNCIGVFNPDQKDSDGDGIGDLCEK